MPYAIALDKGLSAHSASIEGQPMSGGCAITKHGVYSRATQRRYRDKRYGDARELARIMDQLVDDLGGQESLTTAQHILLGLVRSKLTVLMQLSKYLDSQASIIDQSGKPLECLSGLHIQYSKALRQDLETLCGLDRRKAKPGGSLASWIQEQNK